MNIIVAVVCALVAPWLLYQGIVAYAASSAPWSMAGFAVLALLAVFGLWWLFGESSPTGLQLARRTVSRLQEEEGTRNRTVGLAGILFVGTAILLVAMLLAGAL